MTEVIVEMMPRFRKAYKKMPSEHKQIVNKAIQAIIDNPRIGQEKKGDLAGVFVYKFPINNQKALLSYTWTEKNRLLLALGSHENFYRDLKR